MFDISPVVLAIALLIFGPKRLPGLGRDLGRGIRDFKRGITGEDEPHSPATSYSSPTTGEKTATQQVVHDEAPEVDGHARDRSSESTAA